jgi:DNA-binding transcriptional LysR family regulator
MKIDLNLFIVFDVIYLEGNLTKAASVLNLSQPAVSHALARLRTHFDDALFVRQGHKMLPTPLAKNVIADVREALNQLQVTLVQSRQFDPSTSRKQYQMSLHGSLEASYLPFLITRLNKEAPKITLTSTRVRRNELENKLASGDIDVAIDILVPVREGILHKQLAQDPLVVVAARHSYKKLSLSTYLKQNHVLVSSRSSGLGIEDFELGRIGLQRQVGLRCQHYFSACQVIAQSQMLLTLPKTAAMMFSQVLNIDIFPLPVELPNIDVHLYWHVNVDKDPANKWLRNKVIMAAK